MSESTRKLPRAKTGTSSDRIALMILAAGAALWFTGRAAADCGPEIVGRWGGESYAVATSGSMAYTGVGSTLLVVDLSDPTRPVERGRLELPGVIVQMELMGDSLFAACDFGGLQIVDVSDPDHPAFVGEYADGVYAVTVRESRAYILTDYFAVLDVSDPASPVLLGQADEYVIGGFAAQDVAIAGDFAIVSGYVDGLLVYDISNPAQPQHVATHDINPGLEITGVEVDGSLLCAAAWYGRLLIADVSNPLAPQLLSSTHLGEPESNFLPSRLMIQNDRAFVVGGAGLAVVDIADASAPAVLAFGQVDDFGHDVGVFEHGVAVAGGRGGVTLFRSQPAEQWTEVGRLDQAGWIHTAAGTDGYAYVGRLWDDTAIIDLRDAARPQLTRTLPQIHENPATVVEGRLYTAGARVKVLNLANPESPALLGAFDPSMFVRWVDVRGSTVFVAGDRDENGHDAAIYNVSNPAVPQLLAQIQAVDVVEAAGLNDDAWYFSTPSGLHVFDVAEPAAPQSLGVFPAIRFRDIVFSGATAFAGGERVLTLDVSDPANPTVLHTWDVGGSRYRQLALAGAYLIAGPSIPVGDARVFVVADAVNPRLVAEYPQLSGPLSIVDNQAMMLDNLRGMTVVRFGDSADLNLDARVDLHDLTMLLSHFGMSGSVRRWDGDVDGDADVDVSDLLELLGNFGATCD